MGIDISSLILNSNHGAAPRDYQEVFFSWTCLTQHLIRVCPRLLGFSIKSISSGQKQHSQVTSMTESGVAPILDPGVNFGSLLLSIEHGTCHLTWLILSSLDSRDLNRARIFFSLVKASQAIFNRWISGETSGQVRHHYRAEMRWWTTDRIKFLSIALPNNAITGPWSSMVTPWPGNRQEIVSLWGIYDVVILGVAATPTPRAS